MVHVYFTAPKKGKETPIQELYIYGMCTKSETTKKSAPQVNLIAADKVEKSN